MWSDNTQIDLIQNKSSGFIVENFPGQKTRKISQQKNIVLINKADLIAPMQR